MLAVLGLAICDTAELVPRVVLLLVLVALEARKEPFEELDDRHEDCKGQEHLQTRTGSKMSILYMYRPCTGTDRG